MCSIVQSSAATKFRYTRLVLRVTINGNEWDTMCILQKVRTARLSIRIREDIVKILLSSICSWIQTGIGWWVEQGTKVYLIYFHFTQTSFALDMIHFITHQIYIFTDWQQLFFKHYWHCSPVMQCRLPYVLRKRLEVPFVRSRLESWHFPWCIL